MRPLIILLLVAASGVATAATPPIVITSQNTLNEQMAAVTDPLAMKDAQRLKRTKAALEAKSRQWDGVAEVERDSFGACRAALEKAAYVAELSGMKANSGLSDKVFDLEKGKLQKLAGQCRGYTKGG